MKKTPVNATDSDILRQKAEAKLTISQAAESSALSQTDVLKLFQELRIQQAELEIQSEELTAVMQSEAETAKFLQELEVLQVELKSQNEELLSAVALAKDATDLYDFAPTGYFTLSREGEILRLNLSGADLLGKDRSKLVKSSFGFFVADQTRPVFNFFLERLFKNKTKESCEIVISTKGNQQIYAHLMGIVSEIEGQCLVTVTDITEHKLAEIVIEKQNEIVSKITQFSVDLSMLPANENLEVFIAKRIKEITGAVGVVYSCYDSETGMLIPGNIELEPGLLKKVVGLLGNQVHKVHSPVNEETYLEITGNIIAKYHSLTDLTFGVVPRLISSMISSLLNVDRYIGIAYLIEGKLYGTSILAMGKNIPDPPDEVLRNIAFLVAVSLRRKQAEDALTQSEVRYRTLYENSLTAILITNPDGSILAANPEACRLLDRTELEICHGGRNGIIDLTNPLLPSAFAERALTGKFRGELTFKHSDGTIFPVDMVSSINVDTTGLKNSNIFFQDITKRKLAEEALQYEQWRLQSLIEGTNVGTWEWNVQTGETIYNEQWANIIGYSLDELQPINISVWEKFTHPDDLKQSAEILQKHFAGELPYYECECRMKHKDGHWIWVHDRGSVITRTSDGKPLMMFGTHTDITERKETEKALIESEANLLAIFNATDESVILISADETIISLNETAAKRLERSISKLNGQKVYDILPPEVMAQRQPMLKQVVETGEPVVFKDQHSGRWLINHIYPILDQAGKVGRMAIFSRDITEQKVAENAIRETESRFRLAADNAPVLIWQSGTDALCNFFNQPWLNFTGRTFEQEYGNGWAEGVHPDDLQSCIQIYMNSFAAKRSFEMEYRLRRADGEYRWLLDHGIPRFTPDREFQGYIGSCFDITESKQIKDALSESESRFRRLYESASLGIFQSTPEGKVISVNPSFAKMFGYNSPEELKDKISNVSIDLFADPNRRKEIIRLLEINPDLNSFENIYRRKDGSTFIGWLNVTRINDQDGRFGHMEGFIEDITERKQAEKALLKSKDQYDKLAANIPVGVYILHSKADGSFALDYASPRMAEMLNQSVESLLEDAGNVFNDIHPDDLSAVVKLNEDGIRLIQPFDWTGRIVSGGEIKWMHFRSLPELLENGEILWHGLIVDITKEKLAEDALTEAHNRLLKITRLLPGVVFQYKVRPDGTSCFPYASEGIKEIFQVSPDEILEDSSKMFARIHPDDVDGFIASMQVSAEKNAPWEHEFQVKYDDGTIRALFGSSMPQKEQDGSLLWHGFVTDISERKQAERALRESELRFKNLFEHHSAIMLLIDPASGLIMDANEAATRFYGYSKSELQSMKIEDINVMSREKVKIEREKARINKLNYFVFRHKLASGKERTVEVHSSPIDFQEKQILFSIIHDITERRIAENEIQVKNEELLKVNAEKDKFFSIIAHDLRGPIGGFMGLTEHMAEGMAKMTLDDLQKIARVMKKSASNLYSLLGNLLEWSRMQRGLIAFEPVSVLLMPKISEYIVQAHDSATKKAIAFNTFIPDNLKVYVDENMLACIIRNLVTNAVKFTPNGGNISISATALNNNFAEISISDSGIGMSKDLIENLFTLDVNTCRKGTDGELSSGLGLMICKDFIERHGGELRIESEVGKGSTFKFTIPASRGEN